MKSIRVKNLRAFKDTGKINLQGFTVIVGENSVGKSTLLRILPLIKQSLEIKTTSPFLWYGRYVDFGDFEESINRNIEDKIIEFEFEIDLTSHLAFSRLIKMKKWNIEEKLLKNLIVVLQLAEKNNERNNYIKKILLKLGDNEVEIFIDGDGEINKYSINGKDYKNLMEGSKFINLGEQIIPILVQEQDEEMRIIPRYRFNMIDEKFLDELANFIKSKVSSRTSDQSIKKLIDSFKIDTIKNFKEIIIKNKSELESWNKYIKNEANEKDKSKLLELYLGSFIPLVLNGVEDYFGRLSTQIYYIAPLRANVNRYYRNQNLAIDSVDFQGVNVPMILANLSTTDAEAFEKWTETNFGFRVKTEMSEGHISIKIQRKDEIVNIVDCGFGYSQILPIITQLWIICEKNIRRRSDELILIIEQPELHLHPKMQANLVDIFAKCIKSRKINIIIETHSEVIVNRLGYLINQKEFENTDANLYIVNKESTNNSVVEMGMYDEEGYLENWPLNFFSVGEI